MPDALNALAAEAATRFAGGTAYTYGGQDALSARVLIVEEGGASFPTGKDIGSPTDEAGGKWASVLEEAGLVSGTYSWWNAVPCGLDRKLTADDRARGAGFLRRAVELHTDLHAIVAVGSVTQSVVKAARTGVTTFAARSPLRSSNAERERIVEALVLARKHAYPLGIGD
ncbi:MAG: hypothetical protein JWO22_2607 [Frankiales bacterium]|nr:hypothetical protein [Frankiales bacterium]